MKRLPIFLINLIMLCAFGCGSKAESNQSDNIIQRNDTLIGKWLLVEYDSIKPIKLNDTIHFNTDDSYYRTLNESGEWSYKYINPDSLIIYNRGFGEQRFTVVRLSNDTLILQLKENLIYPDFVDSLNSKNIDVYIRVD